MLLCLYCCLLLFFFFKQKTAYEMRISDWSSDVCSSDLQQNIRQLLAPHIFEDADGEDDVEAFVGKGNVPRVGDMAKVHGRAGTISFGVEPCERDGLDRKSVV